MNKYYKLLTDILEKGETQINKKGSIIYLLNQKLSLNEPEIVDLFKHYKVAKTKLNSELELYLKGELKVNEYRKQGIKWWDYIGEEFKNSYPTYYKQVPSLINKINEEQRPSKNYIFFNGETNAETNQLPCISLIQFQIPNNKLSMTIYQRSADSNLGLPSDIYQAYLLSKKLNFPLKDITFFIGNAHIYDNNILETKKMLNGEKYTFNLNV